MRGFLPFLGEKGKKYQQKAAKCFIMSYSTCPASQLSNFKRFRQFLIFRKIQVSAQNGGHLG